MANPSNRNGSCARSSSGPRATSIPGEVHTAIVQTGSSIHSLGYFAIAILFLRAYSLGGGPYTGIEAVSNGLPILREPHDVTGKRTMIYMSVSLAFVAGGILFGYMLFNVGPQAGKTLNAVLFEKMSAHWTLFGLRLGTPIVTFTLLTEGALLFVAAQTGFVDGPRVLAAMASDRWLPRRFSNLSARLVTQDGVQAMGLAAALILIGTHARVDLLVVLYAINVFITFTLLQLGMTVHWWQERRAEPRWSRKLLINGVGCTFTGLILVLTVALKFDQGGWVTVVMTGGLIAACMIVRAHYARVQSAVEQLEADVLPELFAAAEQPLFFAGKLIFTNEFDGFVRRFLHNHTALEVQNWLKVHGLSLVILPVRAGHEHVHPRPPSGLVRRPGSRVAPDKWRIWGGRDGEHG
jgi:amino acid transporter